MLEWEERIASDTRPAIRVEHDVRYAAAAPFIAGAPVWADLGCGTGVAAAAAVGNTFGGRAVLVDRSREALDDAVGTIVSADTTALAEDLANPAAVARVGEAIRAAGTGGVVTCFEVIEHLETFVPVLGLMRALADDHGFTVLLSVPNDAFWAHENPFHKTMWGEGSFEELRRLLPAGHTFAHQVSLSGSAIVPAPGDRAGDDDGATVVLDAVTTPATRVPSHFIAVFGPRAGELGVTGRAIAADLDAQRTWERQREANLAFYEAAVHENTHRRRLPWRRALS
jgi:hypothetical protein